MRMHAASPGARADERMSWQAARRLSAAPVIHKKAACQSGHAAFSAPYGCRAYSPRYAARTFGSSSICFASPDIVTVPESIT